MTRWVKSSIGFASREPRYQAYSSFRPQGALRNSALELLNWFVLSVGIYCYVYTVLHVFTAS